MIELAIHDIPPLIQSSALTAIAAIIVYAWTQTRGMALFKRDGRVWAREFWPGVLFALEFVLIYRGLVWTTATRGVLFFYFTPFFVVIGSRWLVPGDRFFAGAMAELAPVVGQGVVGHLRPADAGDRSPPDARRCDVCRRRRRFGRRQRW